MNYPHKTFAFVSLISLYILIFGCNRNKNVDQLQQEIISKEALFEKLVTCFTSALPDSNYIVAFGIDDSNSVNLSYYKNEGNMADPNNRFGGEHLKLHSPALDKALQDLGWTYETINTLTTMLKSVKFEYIRNIDAFGKPVNIYNATTGFVNSDIQIYPLEMLDIIKSDINSTPVGKAGFLKRVYIITTSAL